MKKFVSILSVIAIMFTFIACSEDLYLHNGEDGEDGATGPQGPKGDKGDPGQVELSFVPVPATTEECPSGGYKTEIYINGVLNYTLPAVCNGESLNIEDLNLRTDLLSLDDHCKIRVMYNNDKEFFRDTVCNGETPEAYIPEFTTTTVPLNEFCKVRQVFLDGNLLYADTICNGQNGEDGQNIDYRLLQYSENFNTASSYFLHNVMLWNVLGTQASSNHIGAPKINTNGHTESYNGTMVMDNLNSKDTVWCPLFIEPAALNYLKCDIGSGKDGYGLIFFVKYQNGQSEVLDSINIAGVPNFVWYDNTTWEYQEYVFEIPSKDIKRWDVVRWGLRFTSVDGSPMPEDKNLLPHLDNVHYTTLQIVQ